MKKKTLLLLVPMSLLMSLLFAQSKPDESLQKALSAMGTDKVNSVQYSGIGKTGSLGQSHAPGMPWPLLIIKSYTRSIDYGNMSSVEDAVRVYDNPPAKGGGAPFLDEQKQTNVIRGSSPVDERQLQILITPHGFLKQAQTHKASSKSVQDGAEISFSAGKYNLVGKINQQGLVEKVSTWVPNHVLGDMLIETLYADYKDYNGIKFPTHIIQNQGGYKLLELTVSDLQPNVSVTMPPPPPPPPPPQPMVVDAKKLGDGIWFLSGGSHNSMLVEFRDHLAVLEAPLHEARSMAVIDEVKKLIPNKPIRYVVNSHHHFDHSGGLRAYVAEGVTVITHAINSGFFQEAWKAPRTISPDKLSQNPKQAVFLVVNDKYTLSDGTNTLELYHNQNSPHNAGMLIGYFPKEKILFVVDEYSQGRLVNGKLVPVAKGFAQNLYANLQRLKLDVSTIAPGHGTVVQFSDLLRDLEK